MKEDLPASSSVHYRILYHAIIKEEVVRREHVDKTASVTDLNPVGDLGSYVPTSDD